MDLCYAQTTKKRKTAHIEKSKKNLVILTFVASAVPVVMKNEMAVYICVGVSGRLFGNKKKKICRVCTAYPNKNKINGMSR